eukprot:CAMPEP_0174897774 /NCGR_PEP_ID=MMETSP0167-20121228/16785_1 /TAXON_ID=38298 /ORGANISM="Rhodella maculata, Strain CCMP736" /LENGTH=131 /DNA_ID=CAMNT_0016137999 /DNA_START=78 /DNA_END=470 /DNA_ORIENTATION=-
MSIRSYFSLRQASRSSRCFRDILRRGLLRVFLVLFFRLGVVVLRAQRRLRRRVGVRDAAVLIEDALPAERPRADVALERADFLMDGADVCGEVVALREALVADTAGVLAHFLVDEADVLVEVVALLELLVA